MTNRKVALVMHGMNAIGTAICRRLHDDGFTVAATWSASERTPEAWLAAQRDDGYAFTACGVDVADADACAIVVERLLATHGRLDMLVNQLTAEESGNTPASCAMLGELAPDAWRTVVRRGLEGVFNLDKLAIVPMLEQRWGRIVQIAATPAWPGARRQSVSHAAANAALHGMTRALALEVARHGVTVNTIAPGYLERAPAGFGTSAAQRARMPADAQAAAALPHIPVGRLGAPADVAGLVAYLASENAAFVTGAQIAVNGGQHMA
jgi:acetoacetyl-CoA reductase